MSGFSRMHEDEARKRTCPLSIGIAPLYVNGEGVRDGGPWACLGSACMARRWAHPGFDHSIDGQPIPPVEAEGGCGLAGPL